MADGIDVEAFSAAIATAVTQAVTDALSQEPEAEAAPEPEAEVPPDPTTPSLQAETHDDEASVDAEVELARMKALMTAYLPADLNIDEELKAVYGSPEDGFGYRKPEVTPQTTQTGRRIMAPSKESAPPSNGTRIRAAGQPGYITIGAE